MTPDRTLIQIRERTFLDLLDLALVVVRRRPRALGLAALAGIAPCAALNAYLTSDPEFNIVFYLVLLMIEAPWATAPLTVVLGGLMFGERPSVVRVVRVLLRGLPALLIYQLILRSLMIVSVVMIPLVPSRLAFVDEVVLLERGPVRSISRRGSTLCGERGGDLFGAWIGHIAFGMVFVSCFWMGTGAMLSALTTSELTWDEPGWGDLYGLRFQFAVWLTIAFFGVVRFLTYIDQRIRLEGWELKLRLRAVGRSFEEASRW